MEQQSTTTNFIQSLSDLNSKLDNLSKLLLQEETALTEQNFDSTEAIASAKEQMTLQVEQAEKARLMYCAQLQISPDKKSIQRWLKTKPAQVQKQVSELWKRITYLGQKCSNQNQINGIMVAHLQRHTQDALSVLRGEVTSQDSYSHTGSHENKQNQKIIAKA